MSRKTDLILFTTSFLSGLITGLLLVSNEEKTSRNWFSKNLLSIDRWTEMQPNVITQKGSIMLLTFKSKVHQHIRHHIPDLYEAINSISMNKKDMPSG